jgi:hypothetical protein
MLFNDGKQDIFCLIDCNEKDFSADSKGVEKKIETKF